MKKLTLIACCAAGALTAGGLAVIGHQRGWLRGGAETSGQCRHGIDRTICAFCDASLIESMGWCKGHEVPEAFCTRCLPDVIPAFKVEGDWCAEHDLPESQCALCGNGPTRAVTEAGTPDATQIDLPRMQRAPSSTCATGSSIIRLASPGAVRQAGLRVDEIRTQAASETLEANASIAFNGNRYAHLAARAPGIVAQVNVDLGARVEAGAVLAVVDSVELGTAKAEFLQATALVDLWERNNAREQELLRQHISTERDLLEAENKLVESRIGRQRAAQKLRNLGLDDADLERLSALGDTSSLLPVVAPFAGVVVERHAVVGEVTGTSEPLFALADTATMWAIIDVDASDVSRIQTGQRATLSLEGVGSRTFEGPITWVSAHVDARTRTLKARAELENPEGLLRANLFGRAVIALRTLEEAVLVPRQAVQWDGCCNVVFVAEGTTSFRPRQVKLGFQQGDSVLVEEGLKPGELVVIDGSFLLKTELLKGQIGAGCCEVDPGKNREG